ncbi:HlyD family secretion protein [Vibrio fluminensis]|uniref:HlyD family secretion protein n=1 Tax=Vibrio fluminensis TaxID=2783614 RepID=UPI00188700B7|nr:HlyD family secretion protein [Vibrio fluminensis]
MKVNFHLDKQNKPDSENGMKVVYGSAKRSGYRIRWYLILFLVISPLLFMAYYLFRTQILITAPAIVTSYPVTFIATQPAVVGEIPFDVGISVAEGDPLLILKNNALNEEVAFIQEELIKLSSSKLQPTSKLYEESIKTTKLSLRKVEQIQRKYDKFRKNGQVSEVDYAAIVNMSSALNSQLNTQKIAYVDATREKQEIELAGPVSQERRSLIRELIIKKALQESLTYHSPFDGRILDIHIHEGERVTENDPLFTVARNVTPEITAFLNPKYLRFSQLGTQATIVFPDGQRFAATVSRPVEVVNKLPPELQSPFEGQPAYLKITLSFDQPLEKTHWIEGVEVEVRF